LDEWEAPTAGAGGGRRSRPGAPITGQLLAVDGGVTKGALLGTVRLKSTDSAGAPGATM